MSEDIRKEGREFAAFLQGLPEEVRIATNKRERARAEAEHGEWQQAFRAGTCSLCHNNLTLFNKDYPCPHWLLKPVGFTKWHFMDVAKRFSCAQLQAYLRWVASEEAFGTNINDLKDEGTGKLIELTIRYQKCEWSFSCSENDYVGHATKFEESQRPHYHFQMRFNKQAFVRFNDFHVPLSNKDVHLLEAMRAAPDLVKQRFTGGPGMSELLNEDTLETLVMAAKGDGDETCAPFKLDTFIIADEGTTINGDDVWKAIEEAKRKGVTMTSQMMNLPNVKVRTIVTPGPGVVEQTPRSGRGKKP